MRSKKAQAAMEFLMTYGWAILVVLAAIGALAYFGVLSPDRFLPEKCTLPSGMACLDFVQEGTNGVTLILINSGGFDMANIDVNITSAGADCSTNVASFTDGQQIPVTITCGADFIKGKFKTDLDIRYNNTQTGLVHTKTGELIMKIS